MSEDVATAAVSTKADLLLQFEYIRDFLRTPSENLTTFTNGLAIEGTVIDELLESEIIHDDSVRSSIRADLKSKSRMQQAEILLEKISACREVPIVQFLFFLSTQRPGIINIIEEDLLARVTNAIDTNWNRLEAEAARTQTLRSEEASRMDSAVDQLAKSGENKRPIAMLCVGKTGAGKSTLANALMGKLATDEGSAATGRGGNAITKNVEVFQFSGKVPFTFWDTPGLTETKEDRKAFKKMKQDVEKQGGVVDLLILCAPAQESRDSPENSAIIENLTKEFGKKIWEHSVVVFTQANLVVDPDHKETTAAYFNKHCVYEMTRRYRKFLVQMSGLSPSEAEMIPCVPLGRQADIYLADGTEWKKNFWITCTSRVSADIRGILTTSGLYDSDRFAVPMNGIDKVRLVLGMTGVSVGGAAVGIGTGIGIAVRIGIAAGALAAAPTGPGAAIGAAVGAVSGFGVGVGVYFAIRAYQRYKGKK